MVIPYYENIVNENKHGKFDMYERDKFIGFIMPDGKIFECTSGHGFTAGLTAMQHFFNCALTYKSQEDCITYMEMLRKRKKEIMTHKDKLFLIPLYDWQINYAKNYYNLDSEFMKKFNQIGWDPMGGCVDSCDFLVQLLNFDKVERLPKTITTSKVNINEAFFNYLIMDFNIVQIPKVGFDVTTSDFNYLYPNEFIQYDKEKEFEENIQLIKKYIPLSERPKYFK